MLVLLLLLFIVVVLAPFVNAKAVEIDLGAVDRCFVHSCAASTFMHQLALHCPLK